MNQETPEGLHRMQYAIHILEEVLGWPSKGNAELLADCILSISKSRRLSIVKAHDYIMRAIKLANEQAVTVDRLFFMNGDYTKMRPEAKNALPLYKPDNEGYKQAQEWRKTPEFQQFVKESAERINKAFGVTK